MLVGKRFCGGSNRKTPKSPSIQGFWRHLSSVNLRQNPERQEILKTVWGQPHKGSNSFLSATKKPWKHYVFEAFLFFALWLFHSFLPDFYHFSRKFSAHKKFRKPLLHMDFRGFDFRHVFRNFPHLCSSFQFRRLNWNNSLIFQCLISISGLKLK